MYVYFYICMYVCTQVAAAVACCQCQRATISQPTADSPSLTSLAHLTHSTNILGPVAGQGANERACRRVDGEWRQRQARNKGVV